MNKKKVFKVIFVSVTVWILLGMYVRRDVPYLMNYFGLTEGKSPKKHIKEDDFVFGYRKHLDLDILFRNIHWFSDEDNAKLWSLIQNSKLGPCGVGVIPHNDTNWEWGTLYVFPRWVRTLGLTKAVLPFTPYIVTTYWPSHKFLYISQDIEELCYDLMYGLNITNVPPGLLDIPNNTTGDAK